MSNSRYILNNVDLVGFHYKYIFLDNKCNKDLYVL